MTLLWIPLTIAAAFLQNVRSALQKHLKGRLGTTGATFVRFGYGFPVALVYLAGLVFLFDFDMPAPNASFAGFVVMGGLAQITATALLVTLFDARNFAVGTTYSKTETVQAAVFALVFLGESISMTATIGILVSLVGVIAISSAKSAGGLEGMTRGWNNRAALIGLASGLFRHCGHFGARRIAVTRRRRLSGPGRLHAGRDACLPDNCHGDLYDRPKHVRTGGRAESLAGGHVGGASGAVASIGWFTAMTIQNAALVRALGQIELVFTIMASVLVFREKIVRMELIGIVLVVSGILILLMR